MKCINNRITKTIWENIIWIKKVEIDKKVYQYTTIWKEIPANVTKVTNRLNQIKQNIKL